jgi:hypothetical protein
MLSVIVLNVVMLIVVMLIVIMLSVVMLNVVAPVIHSRGCATKHYGFVIYGSRNKLARLSKSVKVTDHIKKHQLTMKSVHFPVY